MLSLRTLTERFARGQSFMRRLPAPMSHVRIIVSPDSQLKYAKLGRGGFDPELLDVVEGFVRPRMPVWDIGANVGVFAVASAAQGAHVLAVEPDPFLAGLLRRSARLNARQNLSLRILSAAISQWNGVSDLMIARRGRASNALIDVSGSDQMGGIRELTTVPTLTLDTLATAVAPPSFIKIDVEGAELLVLKGATELLRSVRPSVYIEVSDENVVEATEIFHSASYRLYSPKEMGRQLDRCVFNTIALPD